MDRWNSRAVIRPFMKSVVNFATVGEIQMQRARILLYWMANVKRKNVLSVKISQRMQIWQENSLMFFLNPKNV